MYLIVGCGLSGAVIAERLATQSNSRVLIIDKRDHIGGNCYDYVDLDTNIRVNKYKLVYPFYILFYLLIFRTKTFVL